MFLAAVFGDTHLRAFFVRSVYLLFFTENHRGDTELHRVKLIWVSEQELTAFAWLAEQVRKQGDVLPRSLLEQGFILGYPHPPPISPQGIFKPRQLEIPLTITTTSEGPYDDSLSRENLLLYKYRGTDPMHRDNIGLRQAMQQ